MAVESPVELTRYLGGVDFPCSKDDLVHHAEAKGATDEVLDLLEDLPEQEYGTMADVTRAYGRVRG